MISRLEFIHPKVTRKYVFYKALVRITSAYRIHQSAIIIASTIGKDVLLVVQQPPTPHNMSDIIVDRKGTPGWELMVRVFLGLTWTHVLHDLRLTTAAIRDQGIVVCTLL